MVGLVCIAGGLFVACNAAGAQTGNIEPVGPVANPPPEVEDLLARLDDARAEQERIQSELGQLSVEELVDLLNADSEAGVEPFNSLAFREIERRGEAVGQELAEVVRAQGTPSILAILAVREVNRAAYQASDPDLIAGVLVQALTTSAYFNTWGLPHLYWEDAALAVIEQGEAAVEPLTELLDDDRPALLFGSEEAAESQRFGYRVKDYALALLLEIRGQPPELPIDPLDRDSLIDDFNVGG